MSGPEGALRVAIDAAGALRPGTGIGRYTVELVKGLVRVAPELRLVLFANSFRDRVPDEVRRLPARVVNPRIPARVLLGAWRRLRWPPIELFTRSVDVLHTSDWVHPPQRSGASVATVHDVAALEHPGWYAPDVVEIHRRKNRAAAEGATAIIAVSRYTRERFLALHDVDPARVHVVHNGVSEEFRPAGPEGVASIRTRRELRDPFLLYVGTRERRKNVAGLLEIFRRVARERGDVTLALAGMRPRREGARVHGVEAWSGAEVEERIGEAELAGRVRVLGHVDGDELRALYSAAAVFVFPSLYEGFGLPVLEAMACGLPVVASDRTALPEVVGDAGVLADPEEPEAFAGAVLELLEDGERRAELRERGLERAGGFRWEAAAAATRDVYRRAAGCV